MGKGHKIIIVLGIIAAILLPMFLVFIPSMGTIGGLVNTLSLLDDPSGIGLGTMGFINRTDDTVDMVLGLSIDNSDSTEDIIFPAMNITLSYGADHLGDGWVSEMITIPAGQAGEIPIYARMNRGEVFSKFILSALAGGLALGISSTDIYVFLDSWTFDKAGGLMISLAGGIEMPPMDLLGDPAAYIPQITDLVRASTASATEIKVNFTDKGNGMSHVLLNYSVNSGAWVAQNMTGLPSKELMGGNNSFLGWLFSDVLFPELPPSSIAVNWMGEVEMTGTIDTLLLAPGTTIEYKVVAVDAVGQSMAVPAEAPVQSTPGSDYTTGSQVFTFTVPTTSSTFNATWQTGSVLSASMQEPATKQLDALGDILGGMSIEDILFEGSELLSSLFDMFSGDIDPTELLNQVPVILKLLEPMIEYLAKNKLNIWEMMDQMVGLSGGSPMFIEFALMLGNPEPFPNDVNWSDNSNPDVAFDMIAESGVSLLTLMDYLEVNFSKIMDQVIDGFTRPISLDETPGQTTARLRAAFLDDLNTTGQIPEFIDNLSNYRQFPIWAFHENNTDYFNPVYTNYTYAASNPDDANTVMMGGNPNDCIYFGNGSGMNSGLGHFDALYIEIGNANTNATFAWEYYDGADWVIIPYSSITDETNNLTQSGAVMFPESVYTTMAKVSINGVNATYWYRLRVLEKGTITPSAQAVKEATLRIPYKLRFESSDFLGRPTMEAYADEILTLEQCWANMDNGSFAGQFYGVMGEEGYGYSTFLAMNNITEFAVVPAPVSTLDVISAQAIMMGIIIYTLLIVSLYTASYSVKNKYQVSEDKVSKWYDEITQKSGKKGEMA